MRQFCIFFCFPLLPSFLLPSLFLPHPALFFCIPSLQNLVWILHLHVSIQVSTFQVLNSPIWALVVILLTRLNLSRFWDLAFSILFYCTFQIVVGNWPQSRFFSITDLELSQTSGFPGDSDGLTGVQETRVQSLGQEVPLKKGMATHSSILAWEIPWTEEPGGLQSLGSQSQTRLSDFHIHARSHSGMGWYMGPDYLRAGILHLLVRNGWLDCPQSFTPLEHWHQWKEKEGEKNWGW